MIIDKKTTFESLVREAHERGIFNGAWLYAEHGEIVSKGAVGFRDAEDKLPMRENSIFELASVSKQFTAAAIMLLRKRGLLSLEDELSEFFPENPYKGITVYHLLTHTSGLPDHEEWAMENLKGEKTIPDNCLCVRFLRESGLALRFEPGEQFEYSNTAYCLLAEIVKQVSGVPFEDFMRREIFEPCGMKSTRVCHIRAEGIPFDNFARGLVPKGGGFAVPDELEEYSYVILLDGVCGDGLVYSNIFDMLAWDRALREEALLSKDEQTLMYTPGTLNSGENGTWGLDNEIGYGFGWDLYRYEGLGLAVLHDGGWPGYLTHYERFIDEDRMLVFLCSRTPEDERGYDSFYDGMRAIARGGEPAPIVCIEDIAVKNPDKSSWESFCGRYEKNDGSFPLEEVCIKDGELYGKVAWDGEDTEVCRLYQIGEHTFTRKNGFEEIVFVEDQLTVGETVCRKL